MAVSDVVGMDGAEALQGGGGEGNARRATDVLHPLHLTNTPLEHTAEKSNKDFCNLTPVTCLKVSIQFINSQENEGEQKSHNSCSNQHGGEDGGDDDQGEGDQ